MGIITGFTDFCRQFFAGLSVNIDNVQFTGQYNGCRLRRMAVKMVIAIGSSAIQQIDMAIIANAQQRRFIIN